MNAAAPGFVHVPVMLDEVVEVFDPVPPGVVLDATVGGGGHADAVLASRDDLRLVGLDQDAVALEAAAKTLVRHGDRVTLRQARFDQLGATLDEIGFDDLVGVIFDLGVSSPQVDEAERGFSYRSDGPLDMRMDTRSERRAADLVNEATEDELSDVLGRYGDERHARRIAAAIVARRPLSTTAELADVVRDAIPAPARRRGGHPAKRTFQAIRIAVNDELAVLEPALDQAIDRLVAHGRGAVLSYHSGEDRIVKRVLRAHEGRRVAPRRLPVETGPAGTIRPLTRGAVTPTAAEVEQNPRAASARLRGFERLEEPQA